MGNSQYEMYREAVERVLSHDPVLLEAVQKIGSVIDKHNQEITELNKDKQTEQQKAEHQKQELEAFKKMNLTERGQLYNADQEKYNKLKALLG